MTPYIERWEIVAVYGMSEVAKARAMRAKLRREGKQAFLTRTEGEHRYSGLYHVSVKLLPAQGGS